MADQQTGYKVFVGDLPVDISEVELRAVFQTYGEVLNVFVMQPNAKGQCCALVMYATVEAAEDSIKVLDNVYKIREDAQYPIKVSWARDKGDRGGASASGPPADDSGFKMFVGGLPVDIREEELKIVFSTYGEVNKVHIMPPKDSSNRVAAFVYYATVEAGEDAMRVLHNQYKIRQDADAPIQVRWAASKEKGAGKGWNAGGSQGGSWNNYGAPQQSYGGGGKGGDGPSGEQKCVCPDGYKLFVAGLPPDCTEEELRMVFSTYGEVNKVHVMPPHQITGRVAAFVVYVQEKSADDAIQVLSGVYKIRENAEAPILVKWANDKSGGSDQRWSGGGYGGQGGRHHHQEQQQWGGKGGGGGSRGGDWQHGNDAQNSKLFVGSLPPDVSEESLTYVFSTYGKVVSVHVMQGKSQTGNACAFVEYASPDQADVAIMTLHDKYEIKPGFGTIVVKKANSKPRSRPY